MLDADDIVSVDKDYQLAEFKNDWQNRLSIGREPTENSGLAHATQAAFERSILSYAKVAKALTGCSKLVAFGGTFLNILANTRIAESGLTAPGCGDGTYTANWTTSVARNC